MCKLSQGSEFFITSFFEPVSALEFEEYTTWYTQGQRYLAYQEIMELSDGQAFDLMIIRNIQYLGEYQKELMRFSVLIVVLSTLIISLLGFVLFRHLTRPFQELEAGARRIASGEYTERVIVNTKDEIGSFANTFNSMADSIEKQIKEMDELVADRQRFIDHVAHEIRTPITAMIGFSEVMLHAKATETDKQRAAEYIGEQSTRLKLLSEKLLNLSRLKYDKVEFGSVNILAVINAAEETLHSSLNTKDIRLK